MLMKVNICTFSNWHLFHGTDSYSAKLFKSGDHPPEAWVCLRFLPLKRKILRSATELQCDWTPLTHAYTYLYLFYMWTFHVRCIYSVGGHGNHCSSGQQSCWVNIDTGNPTRVPKSMPSDSVFSYTRPCTHFKPSGTGAPLVCSLEAEKTKFYCRPLDFWSQLTNYSFRCLIFFLINVPVNFPWQWERSTWFKLKNTLLTAADQMAVQKVRCGGRAGPGLSGRESRCSSGGPLSYSFPSGQICLWFFY